MKKTPKYNRKTRSIPPAVSPGFGVETAGRGERYLVPLAAVRRCCAPPAAQRPLAAPLPLAAPQPLCSVAPLVPCGIAPPCSAASPAAPLPCGAAFSAAPHLLRHRTPGGAAPHRSAAPPVAPRPRQRCMPGSGAAPFLRGATPSAALPPLHLERIDHSDLVFFVVP